jgi:hypothetical protein
MMLLRNPPNHWVGNVMLSRDQEEEDMIHFYVIY